MKRTKTVILIAGTLILFLLPTSCNKKTSVQQLEKKIEYRNSQMILDFPLESFLPKDTIAAQIPGKNQSWIAGDFDGDSLGEVLFAYHFSNTPKDDPTMGAMLLKQESGKWIKKYEYREKATNLYTIQARDITGDKRDDLILGWETNQNLQEKHIYLYRWKDKDLESIGNFVCTKLDVGDFEGIYGRDNQYELGIWKQTDNILFIDISRWNAYTTLPLLFPADYGKPYTENKLSRAEDLEASYFKNYVIPELLTLEKKYPNETMYDFSLIQAYIKALMLDEALKKMESSEGTLYQFDLEKLPFLQAQIYFLKGEIFKGNQLLQKELTKKINRVDAGTTLQLLGRSYAQVKEWDKAMLAYSNAQIFHIAIPENIGYDAENQFQFSLAKDKSRLEVNKHFSDLRKFLSDQNYSNYFKNHLISSNKGKNIPLVHVFEFYLSLNEYTDSYATALCWEENGKEKEMLFMSIDEDQHKVKFNFAPKTIITEKTKTGWKSTMNFEEKNVPTGFPEEFQRVFQWEKEGWKFLIDQE